MRRSLRLAALVAVCVLSAEIVARIDDLVRYGVPLSAVPDEARDLTIRDSLGIHGRPNGRYRWWHLNAYGFRAPEMAVAPRAGCTRVAVLGSSETFGLYESPNMEYPAQLQRQLDARGCYEVVNAAVAGASMHSMLGLWRHRVARFDPGIVVIYPNPSFYLNTDAPGTSQPDDAGAGSQHGSGPPWWTPRLLDRAHRAFHYPDVLQRRRVAQWLARATAGRDSTWFFRTVPPDRLAQFGADLDSVVRAVRADGATPVLVTHAMPFEAVPRPIDHDLLQAWRRYYPRATPETLLAFDTASATVTRRVGEREGVAVVDAAARLNGHAVYFADFTHFTDTGAGVLAALLADRLAAPDLRTPLAAGRASGPASP